MPPSKTTNAKRADQNKSKYQKHRKCHMTSEDDFDDDTTSSSEDDRKIQVSIDNKKPTNKVKDPNVTWKQEFSNSRGPSGSVNKMHVILTVTTARTPKGNPKPQPVSHDASNSVSGTQSHSTEITDKKQQYSREDRIPPSASYRSKPVSEIQGSAKVTDTRPLSSTKRPIPPQRASYHAQSNQEPHNEDTDQIGLSLMDDWNNLKEEKQQYSSKNPIPHSTSYPSKSVSRAQSHPLDEDGDQIGLSLMDDWNNLKEEKKQYSSKNPIPCSASYPSKSVSRAQSHPVDEDGDQIGLSLMDDWNNLQEEKQQYSSKKLIPRPTSYPSKSISRAQSYRLDENGDQIGLSVMSDWNNMKEEKQHHSSKNPIQPNFHQSKSVSGVQGHPIEFGGKRQGVNVSKEEGTANRKSNAAFLSELERNTPKRFSHEDLKKFTSDFTDRVGRGGFGSVYRGKFLNDTDIVVKVLKDNDFIEETFEAEVSTMFKTSHRYLVKCYGYCFDANMKAIVYEYMENGSLDALLYGNPRKFEWKKFYKIAIKAAKGLSYLHDGCDNQIIHHDLKPANVLIDKNLCAKITDFGMARIMNPNVDHVTWTKLRGTPGFLAPEMSMPGSEITYKCDVYSFGMMLFEVLGMRRNGGGLEWFPKKVWSKFENGELDHLIDECDIHKEKYRLRAKVLSVVALWCVQFTQQARPRMSTVVKMLEGEIHVMEPPNPFYPAPEYSYQKISPSLSVDKKGA